jgi:hypothetical protein
MSTRYAVCALVIVGIACASGNKPRTATHDIVINEGPNWTGTFTNFRVDDVGMFGVEIRTVVTDEPWGQAVVQFAYGDFCNENERGEEPCFRVSNLFLENLESTTGGPTNTIRFSIPEGEFAGTFEGQVTQEALVGKFTFVSGRSLPVSLARSVSFWDR